jgi:hypothetical protein
LANSSLISVNVERGVDQLRLLPVGVKEGFPPDL